MEIAYSVEGIPCPTWLFNTILHDEQRNRKPNNRKQEIKSLVIVDNEFVLQQMLNKMRNVFNQLLHPTGGKTYDGTQQHDELLLGHVFGPPDEEAQQ